MFYSKTDKVKNPKKELPVSKEEILDICTRGGTYYEDLHVSEDLCIDLLVIGPNGVFVFSCLEDLDGRKNESYLCTIRQSLGVNRKNLYLFLVSEDKSCVCGGGDEICLDTHELIRAFENMYKNLSRRRSEKKILKLDSLESILKYEREAEGWEQAIKKTYEHEGIIYEMELTADENSLEVEGSFSESLSVKEQERIARLAEVLKKDKTPHGTRRTDDDGQEWVLKENTLRLKSFDTGLMTGKKWFKVSDRDETTMFWITAILGSLGIHRLLNGEIAAFIGYLLTCGGFGILTVLDILQFLTESAGYEEIQYLESKDGSVKRSKERIYYRNLENKWLIPIGLVITIVVSVSLSALIYKPLMLGISGNMAALMSGMDQEKTYESLKVFEAIFGNKLGD